MEKGKKQQNSGLLTPYRVLDLTDEKAFLCGKLLADLGADVIKVERPGGDSARNIGPFYNDTPDPELSLYWWAFNNNKRSITLNIETLDGQEIFKRLVEKASIVIESFPPGYMEKLNLGYEVLSRINPRIIMVSVTPFGQTGPYREYKGSDLICMAMSGLLYLCGDPDRPPVRISCPQAYLQAGAEAAVGALAALYHCGRTGEGQFVDVSIQASLVILLMQARQFWDLNKVILRRLGQRRGGVRAEKGTRQIWPCKDGYVSYNLSGGNIGAHSNRALVELMVSEGAAPPLLTDETDWNTFHFAHASQQQIDSLEEPIGNFFMTHTKEELNKEAARRKILLYPVATVEDIWNSPQLKDRDFWVDIEIPELGRTVTYPGPFVKLSGTLCRPSRRAPRIGEHNEEIYLRELGLSAEELVMLKQAGVI